jgi:acyl dehydratase
MLTAGNTAKGCGMQLAEMAGKIGESWTTDWTTIPQERINTFADCTDDHQFIHVDPVAAAAVTGTGGTIAHGFLTLSLIGGMSMRLLDDVEVRMGMNYGFDKVRFLAPVPEGSRVRAVFTLADATERKPGQWLLKFAVTMEIEGAAKPAFAAEWLVHCVA